MRTGMRVLGPVLLGGALALWLVAASARAQTGAFAQLSPGGQKIAQALSNAQTPTATNKLTVDQIAEMKKDHEGWGEVFKAMKKDKLLTQKNLGQVVKAFEHQDPQGAKLARAELDRAGKAERAEKPGRVERMERPARPEKPGR